jgi:hypothetical protein
VQPCSLLVRACCVIILPIFCSGLLNAYPHRPVPISEPSSCKSNHDADTLCLFRCLLVRAAPAAGRRAPAAPVVKAFSTAGDRGVLAMGARGAAPGVGRAYGVRYASTFKVVAHILPPSLVVY